MLCVRSTCSVVLCLYLHCVSLHSLLYVEKLCSFSFVLLFCFIFFLYVPHRGSVLCSDRKSIEVFTFDASVFFCSTAFQSHHNIYAMIIIIALGQHISCFVLCLLIAEMIRSLRVVADLTGQVIKPLHKANLTSITCI